MSLSFEPKAISLRIAGIDEPLRVPRGANLREALLALDRSPHPRSRRRLHCGGLGICGTCKVLVREGGEWWERRACQVRVFEPLEIQLKQFSGEIRAQEDERG